MPAGACRCRHSWCLFPVAVTLLAGGCVALVMLGLPTVQLYSSTRHFLSADCYVTDVQYIGNNSCDGDSVEQQKTELSASSLQYPCVIITVYYNDDRHKIVLYKTVADATVNNVPPELHDSIANVSSTTEVGQPARHQQCSLHACSQSSTAENFAEVHHFVHGSHDEQRDAPSPIVDGLSDNVNINATSAGVTSSAPTLPSPPEVGNRRRTCYVDRNNRRAFAEIVTGDRAVHTLWWPSLAVGFGLFLMIVAVCQACYETQSCRRGDRGRSRRNRKTVAAADELPEIAYKKSAAGGSFVPSSACSTCERATLSTTTGTSGSRGSKSRSSESNRSLLLPTLSSHDSTTRSTRSDVKKTPSRQNSLEQQRMYESNTV